MRRLILAASLAVLCACGPSGDSEQAAPAPPPPRPDSTIMQARVTLLAAPYNEANYLAGRSAFGQCVSCHTTNEGGQDRQGPNLYGLFDRDIGAREGFAYSQAVQDANFKWDAAKLDHWLENPRTFLPGNRMAFAGVRDAEQRRNLIAFLMVETAPAPAGEPTAPSE
ncbi:MAG TPA: cytochrome c family protein [Terricaulis sp.]|nr:cytochrome c family protein [Terricaulis sp.]